MRALLLALALTAGCGSDAEEALPSAPPLSRTMFTERVENFFEYDGLRAGRVSRFRIHLTDLAEGTPIGGADVTLRVLSGPSPAVEARASPGSAAGIYLAELTPSTPGTLDLEFRIRSEGREETMRASGFSVVE